MKRDEEATLPDDDHIPNEVPIPSFLTNNFSFLV